LIQVKQRGALCEANRYRPDTADRAAVGQAEPQGAMDAFAKPHQIADVEPVVYGRWRASTIGAITEALQRRLILELLGDVHGRVDKFVRKG
jgi:hypothetical protein